MKIRIAVSREHYDMVKAYLEERHVELGESAEYVLIESDPDGSYKAGTHDSAQASDQARSMDKHSSEGMDKDSSSGAPTGGGDEVHDAGSFSASVNSGSQKTRFSEFIAARDKRRERIRLRADEIVFIEAFGKEIELHTLNETYFAQDRMYQLEELLDPNEFLRISKSVIISRKHVKKIRPSLSMKFILTMSDGTLVDVTRSYYSEFKRFFRI